MSRDAEPALRQLAALNRISRIALQDMGPLAMVIIAVSVVIYLVAYGFPFMAATPGLKYWRSQQLNQAAFAISNGVPAGGAFGLADYFSRWFAHLEGRPCQAPWTGGGPLDDPCPNPDVTGIAADIRSVYGV